MRTFPHSAITHNIWVINENDSITSLRTFTVIIIIIMLCSCQIRLLSDGTAIHVADAILLVTLHSQREQQGLPFHQFEILLLILHLGPCTNQPSVREKNNNLRGYMHDIFTLYSAEQCFPNTLCIVKTVPSNCKLLHSLTI